MVTITSDGPIWTIDLGEGENRFSPDWLDSFDAALDQVEASEGPAALVTVGSGKFFSNGLDLDWVSQQPEQFTTYVLRVQRVFARLLTFAVPTVAAVNGHAFGAGAMLAIAHDYRVMREDRGFVCFPEVDIKIPFTPGMNDLIVAKLPPRDAFVAMTTGRRYGGPDAVAAGMVDAAVPLDQLRETATEKVRDLAGKDRAILSSIKSGLFASVVRSLHNPE